MRFLSSQSQKYDSWHKLIVRVLQSIYIYIYFGVIFSCFVTRTTPERDERSWIAWSSPIAITGISSCQRSLSMEWPLTSRNPPTSRLPPRLPSASRFLSPRYLGTVNVGAKKSRSEFERVGTIGVGTASTDNEIPPSYYLSSCRHAKIVNEQSCSSIGYESRW